MTIEQADEFIKGQVDKKFGKAGEWVQYGIENLITGRIIGDCAIRLNLNDVRIAEIGITISHLEQKNGYGKEVMQGLLAFLFNTKDIHRVVETVDVENSPSISLLKSVGFRQEGHFIENIFFKGKWGSEFQFALLKREFSDNNK
jgi:RimJ/RimL family protein N-acetyltransferase